jgi:hypothetical protein
MHALLPWGKYKLPRLEESPHKVDLVGEKGERFATGISLDKARECVRPGRFLIPMKTPTKRETNDLLEKRGDLCAFKSYKLTRFRPVRAAPTKVVKPEDSESNKYVPKALRGIRQGLKQILYDLTSPADYFEICLRRAYAFLDAGHPVEFTFRYSRDKIRREEKHKKGDARVWHWLHAHFPHLRPDIILEAMPEGAYYLLEPFSDGRALKFILMMPSSSGYRERSLARRLLSIRGRLPGEIERGTVSQLPGYMRRELIERGNLKYSLETASNRRQAARQENRDPVRWGPASLEKSPLGKAIRRERSSKTKLESKKAEASRHD